MMEVKRITGSEFDKEIDDKITEGYKLESKSNNQAVLIKRSFGCALGHFLIFVFTIWWTFGVGNLLYLLFAYFVQVSKLIIKKK